MSKAVTMKVLVEKLREHAGWLARLDAGEWIDAAELPLAEIIGLPSFWPALGWHSGGIALGPMVARRWTLWKPGEELVGFADTIFVNDTAEPTWPDVLLTTAGAIRAASLPIPWQRVALERSSLRGFEIMTDDSPTLGTGRHGATAG